jgi:hypothetical protein
MTARIRVETLRREGNARIHLEFSIPTGQDSFPLKVTLEDQGSLNATEQAALLELKGKLSQALGAVDARLQELQGSTNPTP